MNASQLGFNAVYSEDAPSAEDIVNLTGMVVLEFGAPWCGHCQAATLAVETVFSEHPDLLHIKIFDGKGKRLGRIFKVKLWPTLILLRDGEEVARLVRPLQADEIHNMFLASK